MDFAILTTQELTVSTGSPLDDKELVKQAIDIVDLVGSHIPLRRQGRIFVGLCPWHDDTRPSLQVNPDRQSFKCWVCDIGGDVFSFVMKIEGVEFREALRMLADRAGISLRRSRPAVNGHPEDVSLQAGPPVPVSGETKRTLYRAMAWTEDQYHRCLVGAPEGEPARQYLRQRGIAGQSIERFHLGFAPNRRDWILGQVEGDAKRAEILEAIGVLARAPGGGSPYDRFRGRLLFSIRDAQGRPIGFGGRLLPQAGATSPAKYINSPETPLFTKSKELYGLDVAREAMRKSRRALVMEGYTDVIVAHQCGFDEAVAVLGTALGQSHIRTLKRHADRIVLVLDGDEAGQRRASEVLAMFVAEQVDLQILTLPEGSDPCEFLQQHGADAFAQLLATKAIDALQHALEVKTRGVDLQRDVHGASQALEDLVAIVAKAPRLRADSTREDRFREEKILQRLAACFRVDEKHIRHRLTSLRRQASRRPISARPAAPPDSQAELAAPPKIPPAQRELLEVLVRYPQLLRDVRDQLQPQQLETGPCRRIYETCCRLFDQGIMPDFSRLMLEFDDPGIKSLLVELDENRRAKEPHDVDSKALLRELIETFKREEAEKQRPAQLVALREGGMDRSQETELLEKIIRQERSRQGISESTDG